MKYISLFSGVGGLEMSNTAPEYFCDSDPDCEIVLSRSLLSVKDNGLYEVATVTAFFLLASSHFHWRGDLQERVGSDSMSEVLRSRTNGAHCFKIVSQLGVRVRNMPHPSDTGFGPEPLSLLKTRKSQTAGAVWLLA